MLRSSLVKMLSCGYCALSLTCCSMIWISWVAAKRVWSAGVNPGRIKSCSSTRTSVPKTRYRHGVEQVELSAFAVGQNEDAARKDSAECFGITATAHLYAI